MSIYASFQYLVVVPKSRELSASGINLAESCTNDVLTPPKNIEDVPCILPFADILSIISLPESNEAELSPFSCNALLKLEPSYVKKFKL